MSKIIKRSGQVVDFHRDKIINAIIGANNDTKRNQRLKNQEIEEICQDIETRCTKARKQITVEDVQDMVETHLLEKAPFVAQKFIKYRESRRMQREDNAVFDAIRAINGSKNKLVGEENSNKDANLVSTKRDLVAGEVFKKLFELDEIPANIFELHKKGVIHIHDTDYISQEMANCCLVNLEDMLQNGTVISKTKIESPKSFSVACNVSTQVVAQIASSQYGGQSISLAHLAPFVDVSRKKHEDNVREEFNASGLEMEDSVIKEIANTRLLREIKDGVQTIQYQINTLLTTNGKVLPL